MRQGDFWKFLSGETISVFGSAFTSFALPLLVYQITHSPINLAFDAAAGSLPYLFFGLIGGAFADRVNRKRLMMSMDILNALTVSTIPLLFLLHILRMVDLHGQLPHDDMDNSLSSSQRRRTTKPRSTGQTYRGE